MANDKKIRVGITQGDTNGIGYEVILKALAEPMVLELFTPVIYGSTKIAAFHRKACGAQPIQFYSIDNAIQARDGAYNMVEIPGLDDLKVELGTPSEAAGRAAFASLEVAVADLRNGIIDVLVTAPIDKNNIQSETFHFPGHTEYLETAAGDGNRSLMVLFNDRIRVALVTTHLPVSQIAGAITKEAIIEKLEIFNQSLRKDFAIEYPRIAVLALNPHSGDHGLLGNEEKEIITPAIEEAYAKKICCFGPYSADGFFGNGSYTKFDGVLAMYHDQGLAPFKTIAMDNGVNFTAGLPVVRTSPDHGTGYDIAGKGLASPESMLAAIYASIDIYRNRRIYDEIHANPLRKQYFDKSNDNVVLDLSKDDDDNGTTPVNV